MKTANSYIEVDGLRVTYPGKDASDVLRGLSFSVNKGQIFGFLGPNGAGKTTTIKTLLGLIPCYEGTVSLLGAAPNDLSAKKRLGYMPETANYYWYLTPRELLTMYARLFGMDKRGTRGKIASLLSLVDLEKAGDRLMKTFSKGMLQKVSLAQALINDPELLILDEPAGGLDPVARIRMRDIMLRLRAEGKTIFFSSHELSEVELVCDEVAVVNQGVVVKSGGLKKLLTEKGESLTLEQFFLEIVGYGKK